MFPAVGKSQFTYSQTRAPRVSTYQVCARLKFGGGRLSAQRFAAGNPMGIA